MIICRDVCIMYTVCECMCVVVCLCAVREVPQVGGSGGGWGSRLSAPICCSWPQGQRERKREMIRLLAVHAARGGWLNTTAGVTNWTSLADIIESSPSLLLLHLLFLHLPHTPCTVTTLLLNLNLTFLKVSHFSLSLSVFSHLSIVLSYPASFLVSERCWFLGFTAGEDP